MAIKKLYDVTQYDGQNIAVLRTILDRVSQDTLTFKFTTVKPTINTVAAHEVVLFDNGVDPKKLCVRTGKGNLFCVNIFPLLSPAPPTVTVTSATYTITDNDYVILVDATAAPVTVTLPTAVGREGRIFEVKRISTNANTVTLDGAGAETIDNSANQIYTLAYVSLTVYSDGSNWWII